MGFKTFWQHSHFFSECSCVHVCVYVWQRETDTADIFKGGARLNTGIQKMQIILFKSPLTWWSLQWLGRPQSPFNVVLSAFLCVYIARATGLFHQIIFFTGLFQLVVWNHSSLSWYSSPIMLIKVRKSLNLAEY